MASLWSLLTSGWGSLPVLDWPFKEIEVVFSVFESSSIEAMTWASEGCDFKRTGPLLALWPLPSQGREAEAPLGLLVNLACRAQARVFPQSRECPVYLRVGGARPSPGLAVSLPSCLACAWPLGPFTCSRF